MSATTMHRQQSAIDFIRAHGGGKALATAAGLTWGSHEQKAFTRSVERFMAGQNTTGAAQTHGNLSPKNLGLVAQAAENSGAELGIAAMVTLPRETNPRKWRQSDTTPRAVYLDIDPALAIEQGYAAAYVEALSDAVGGQAADLLQDDPDIDPAGIDWLT